MNIRETFLTFAVLGAMLLNGTTAHAGGPVITTEEAPVVDVRPQGDGGKWAAIVVGAIIICAIACGSDGGPDVTPPSTCNGDDGGSTC